MNGSRQITYNQISKPQQEKVLNYIKIGKEEGAEVITGGTNWSKAPEGYYVMPTILGGTTGAMRVVQEEVSLSPNVLVICTDPRSSDP
jgi:acyl-CoA reductase-like NAD-dependent aldehyde dehydrogenase